MSDTAAQPASHSGSDERAFLHDIASTIGTALFLADALMDALANQPGINPNDLGQLAQINQSLEKTKQLLAERRNILIKRGVPNERP
jgi:hypothetical protein